MARSYLSSPDFTKHSQNLKAARQGLTQVERAHKQVIREGRKEAVATIARLHGLQIGIVAEAWIRKVISDPNGFNDRERVYLRQARSRIDSWTMAVDLAFRRHFAIPLHIDINSQTCDTTTAGQFAVISDLITSKLAPIIGDRNKVAHGQWVWQLNNKETAFVGPAAQPLNYSALLSRAKLIEAIGEIVTVLTLSGWTFKRDYDKLMRSVESAKSGLDGNYYHEFVKRLMARSRDVNIPPPANADN